MLEMKREMKSLECNELDALDKYRTEQRGGDHISSPSRELTLMRRKIVVILLIGVTVLSLISIMGIGLAHAQNPEHRAAWVANRNSWTGMPYDEAGINQLMDKLQSANINVIYVQECNDPHHSVPEDQNQYFIDQAHAHNIDCHLWITAGPYASKDDVDATALAARCEALAQIPNVEGIHLDYIRYIDDGRVSDESWYVPVNQAVEASYNAIKGVDPEIYLSAAVYVVNPPPSTWNAATAVGQDWKTWLNEGYIDFVTLMNYKSQNTEFHKGRLEASLNWSDHPEAVFDGLILVNDAGEWIEVSALEEQINLSRSMGCKGNSIFVGNIINSYIPMLQSGPYSEYVEPYYPGGPVVSGTISGTVTDKDAGLGIEGATVTADGYSTTTNSTGGYTITGVPVGNYTVTASVTGYYSQTQENVEVIENRTTEVNFTLSGIATGTTSGTITNTSGAPIQEATVSANEYSNTTNATGGYTITLPVGNYTVTASKTGYFPESQEKVQILEDQTITVNFQLTEAPDLVGEWHFDEGSGTTAYDSSENSNDGVINGAVYTSSSKLGDYALEFDGNSYVNISDSLSMDFNKSSGTIEFWVKPANPISGASQLLVIDSDYEIEFNIQGDGDLFYYPWVDGSFNNYNLVTDPLTAGDWQHVAVTWEFSTKEVKIYVDGVNQTFAIENVPTYWTALASTGDWHIGGSPVKNQYFNGTFDEVKIYSRALSADEIKADYEAGLEDVTPPETTITSGPDGTIDYNDVSFNWTGSDDVTPTSQLVYSYKLENYDSDWSFWASNTSKSYNDLSNGNYTFKVKAKDEAGNEDLTPAERSFTVLVDLIVTNPSATPSLIPDDTDNAPGWGETTQLNVTVTDDSGILNVTINLSQIGGSSVQPMRKIEGDIWSVTTNASAGTAGWNGTAYVPYHLQVNATDIHGNSNTSVSIELMVMKNGDVTGDGFVDDGDGIRLMNHDYYPEDPRYGILSDTVADVTGDGIVDDGDGIRLMNHDYYPEDPHYMLK